MAARGGRERWGRQDRPAQSRRCDGNIARTAAFIGRGRSAVHRRLKGLGISGGGQGRADNAAAPPAERSIGRVWR